jgi:tetratricopeptide (TPR) repeat protein
MTRNDYPAAIALSERALALVERYPAAIALSERALALVPDGEVDHWLEIDHIDALVFSGNLDRGIEAAKAALERAQRTGERIAELAIRLDLGIWETFVEPGSSFRRLETLGRAALPELEAAGDDFALWVAYWCLAHAAFNEGRVGEQIELMEKGLVYAERLPSPHQAAWSTLAGARVYGPTPVPEVLAWLDEFGQPTGSRRHRFGLHRSMALAMAGEREESLAIVEAVRDELSERGQTMELAMSAQTAGLVARLASDPERAEAYLAEACQFLDERNERSVLSTAAAILALALLDLDRLEEAEHWASRALDLAAPEDVFTQLPARRALAHLHGARGDHDMAERLAQGAVELANSTDLLRQQGEAYETLGEVLAGAGRAGEAAAAFERAADTFARKGSIVDERRARARLAATS